MNVVVVASRSRGTFDSLQKMLGGEFDLQYAERLSQVFEVLAKRPTDLVFVDSRLADCDGREAIREIAGAFPEACLIVLSPAEDGVGVRVREEEGVYAHLWKPLNRELVRFLMKKAMERRKLSRKVAYLTSLTRKEPSQDSLWSEGHPPSERPGKASAYLGRGMIRKLLRSLSPITNLPELLARFADSVRELFGSNSVAIFTWDAARGRYLPGAWQGVDEGLAQVCSFSSKHAMVRWFLEHRQLLTRDKLRNTLAHDAAVEIATDMEALRGEVIMPLLERGNLMGFLSLGKKMTGKRYEEEDLELLALIGDCASGAISMSLMHREVSFLKARADAILNNIACGIVAVDGEARVMAINAFAEKVLNLSGGEVIGKNVQKLGSVLADLVLRAHRDGEILVDHSYRDMATGKLLSVSTCKMHDERLSLRGVLLFFTVMEEAESEAPPEERTSEDEEEFSAFCASIADRIKNPLASIKTFSQLLPEKFDDLEFRQKFSDIVGTAVERINSLADGLTSYAGTGPLDFSPTNLGTVVENAVAALRKTLGSRNLRVMAPGSGRTGMAMADGQLIRSAFLGILSNSIESTPPDGTITISIKEISGKALRRRKSGEVVVDNTGVSGRDAAAHDETVFVETEFRDSGEGIATGLMEKVAQPFFTTKGNKVGLGLAITGQIIARHGGRMEIESEEGEGTTVRIILPRNTVGDYPGKILGVHDRNV